MKAQELKQLIHEEIRKVLSEGKKEKLLQKVIDIVTQEYNKGNKNNFIAMMDAVEEQTGYQVRDYTVSRGTIRGMKAFMVGNFMVIVSLADKPIYKSELEGVKHTEVGDWYIRIW